MVSFFLSFSLWMPLATPLLLPPSIEWVGVSRTRLFDLLSISVGWRSQVNWLSGDQELARTLASFINLYSSSFYRFYIE